MWADFLSHFSEIGNLDAEHTVIKQRPVDHDLQQAQAQNGQQNELNEEEAKHIEQPNLVDNQAET